MMRHPASYTHRPADRYPSVGPFNDPEDPAGKRALPFLPAPDLERIGDHFIGHDPRFSHLTDFRLEYRWKQKSGTQLGVPIAGKCIKPGALLKEFAGCDFILWLAADREWTYGTVEAAVFHELLHAGVDDDGKPKIWPYDFEGFSAEIEQYGFWTDRLKVAAKAVQLRLALDEEE